MSRYTIVYFEETDEARTVKRDCKRCLSTLRGYRDDDAFSVISIHGTAHIGADYGVTACGIDATGPTWWWAL